MRADIRVNFTLKYYYKDKKYIWRKLKPSRHSKYKNWTINWISFSIYEYMGMLYAFFYSDCVALRSCEEKEKGKKKGKTARKTTHDFKQIGIHA